MSPKVELDCDRSIQSFLLRFEMNVLSRLERLESMLHRDGLSGDDTTADLESACAPTQHDARSELAIDKTDVGTQTELNGCDMHSKMVQTDTLLNRDQSTLTESVADNTCTSPVTLENDQTLTSSSIANNVAPIDQHQGKSSKSSVKKKGSILQNILKDKA
jgi:hypothetical protein